MRSLVAPIWFWLVLGGIAATPLGAAEDSATAWYVKADGGVSFVNDLDLEIGGVNLGSVSFDNGYALDIAGGRELLSWLNVELDAGLLSATAANANLRLTQLPFMINGVIQLNPRYLHKWTSFVGVGAGGVVSWLDLGVQGLSIEDPFLGFGLQGLAGIRYAAGEAASVGLHYRFRWCSEPTWSLEQSGLPGTLDVVADDLRTHVFALEFSFRF